MAAVDGLRYERELEARSSGSPGKDMRGGTLPILDRFCVQLARLCPGHASRSSPVECPVSEGKWSIWSIVTVSSPGRRQD